MGVDLRLTIFNRSAIQTFILWLLIVPPGIYYLFLNHYPQEVNWLHLCLLTTFGILTMYFPITRNGKPIFLIMWITVPAFLMYGLLVEILIMQLSIIAGLFKVTSPVSKVNRLFFNSTLLFLLSIGSAFVFYLVGGEIGTIEYWPILFSVFCYQLAHTTLNSFIIRIYSVYSNKKTPIITQDILLNYAVVLVVLPFSLTLYFLVNFIGVGAYLLLGIPFLFITYILRLYNNSEKINDNLQQAGKIGHGLSNNLTEVKVIDQFVRKVSEMFNAEYTYLFDHKDGWLELVRSYEKGKFEDVILNRLSSGQGIAGSVLLENKPVIYSKREEWISLSVEYTPDEMQSILCVPITRNQNIEAVLFLSSEKKDAFDEYQLKILDLLCSYFTVSVEKTRNVEESVKKSERCSLTKLYNYIYLEEQLELEMIKVNNGLVDNLSVLMLDIDLFKKVNDTYGHQSGNDILYNLGRILEDLLPQSGIVGRYGGEEFVYLLPGMSKVQAEYFAEEVRRTVENHLFHTNSDLEENQSKVEVSITVSIGVSGAPEDTNEAKTLLRNADRSLYLGAKQAGRNRVAGYVK